MQKENNIQVTHENHGAQIKTPLKSTLGIATSPLVKNCEKPDGQEGCGSIRPGYKRSESLIRASDITSKTVYQFYMRELGSSGIILILLGCLLDLWCNRASSIGFV